MHTYICKQCGKTRRCTMAGCPGNCGARTPCRTCLRGNHRMAVQALHDTRGGLQLTIDASDTPVRDELGLTDWQAHIIARAAVLAVSEALDLSDGRVVMRRVWADKSGADVIADISQAMARATGNFTDRDGLIVTEVDEGPSFLDPLPAPEEPKEPDHDTGSPNRHPSR